jgi:hypothetical protein
VTDLETAVVDDVRATLGRWRLQFGLYLTS